MSRAKGSRAQGLVWGFGGLLRVSGFQGFKGFKGLKGLESSKGLRV